MTHRLITAARASVSQLEALADRLVTEPGTCLIADEIREALADFHIADTDDAPDPGTAIEPTIVRWGGEDTWHQDEPTGTTVCVPLTTPTGDPLVLRLEGDAPQVLAGMLTPGDLPVEFVDAPNHPEPLVDDKDGSGEVLDYEVARVTWLIGAIHGFCPLDAARQAAELMRDPAPREIDEFEVTDLASGTTTVVDLVTATTRSKP